MRTFRDLMVQAAQVTGLTTAALYGAGQSRVLCAARAAVYRVAVDDLGMSRAAIAREIARDHTCVLNGLAKIDIYDRQYPVQELIAHLRTGSPVAWPRRSRKTLYEYNRNLLLRIDRLVHSGMTIAEIAEDLGNSHASVASARWRWLRRNPTRKIPKRPSTIYTDDMLRKVDTMVHSGMRLADIAEDMECSHESLASARNRWLKRNPDRKIVRVPKPRGPKRKMTRITPEQVNQAVAMRRAGTKWIEVQAELGVHMSALHPHVKRALLRSPARSVPPSGSGRHVGQYHPA